jgi:hypothetical protein
MNKLALAQALVPIADDLDERGFEEELAELDEIIEQLAMEAQVEAKMTKEAQAEGGSSIVWDSRRKLYIDNDTKLPILNQPEGNLGSQQWKDMVAADPHMLAAVHKKFYSPWSAVGGGELEKAYNAISGLSTIYGYGLGATVKAPTGAAAGTTSATNVAIPSDYNALDREIDATRKKLLALQTAKEKLLSGKKGYTGQGAYEQMLQPVKQQRYNQPAA